jgi:phage gp36-like protein
MFLQDTDFATLIQPDIKAAIATDPVVWSNAMLQAEEELTSYLRTRYDVASAMAQIGPARNGHLVMIAVDIALYHIHSRVAGRNIPELRTLRYEQAIEYLASVSKGTIVPNLPVLQSTNGQDVPQSRYGSNKKLNHEY